MTRPRTAKYLREAIDRLYKKHDPEDQRNPFARDYDRLVHKPAFRRLQGKTQVITPGEADFFRTRLTHTLEVAQIARRIAETVGAHPDLVEAAAILHDLGHPPFGHVGEEALNLVVDTFARERGLKSPEDDPEIFDEVGGFNGNAQSFRLAVASLTRSSDFPGLNLTRGVLDGALKYPWFRSEKDSRKWCFFPTETESATWVRKPVPKIREGTKSLEAQIVEWADDVAYGIHDVEDWYKAGFMPLAILNLAEEPRERFLMKVLLRWSRDGKQPSKGNEPLNRSHEGEPYTVGEIRHELAELFHTGSTPSPFGRFFENYEGSTESKAAIAWMRGALFDLFLSSVSVTDKAKPSRRHEVDLVIPREARIRNDLIRDMLWIFVVNHPRMSTQQYGQQQIVFELARTYMKGTDKSAREFAIYSPADQDRIASASPAEKLRLAADHVSGMTDAYARRLHGRLTGHAPGAFNEFL